MDASLGSLVTVCLDNDDLMCADPEQGQRALRSTINRMPDGTVILLAHQRGLNVEANAMIVRDRLLRYYLRRQFGPEAALWQPDRDEQQVSTHESTLFLGRERRPCCSFSAADGAIYGTLS